MNLNNPVLLQVKDGFLNQEPVRICGKFFRCGTEKWFLKGLTYGPFAPNVQGEYLPERDQLYRDFAHIGSLGANAIRLYHVPPRWLLDAALERGLRVLVDVPWEKHRCFFEEWSALDSARRAMRQAAGAIGDHPAVLAISVANEFPKDMVRFYGAERVGRFVDELIDIIKQAAPDCLTTFANYPSTEFLLPAKPDFQCFNVYLDDPQRLGAYLDRLQHIAGWSPLILGEYGSDSLRQGVSEQARALGEHIRQVFGHGLAGSFIFSYTDDWYTAGHRVEDWGFGITTCDRSEKPAAAVVRHAWSLAPQVEHPQQPKVSVVVCSYNGARTLEECLRSLVRLNYPDYEIILVDDGSTDHTAQIAVMFPDISYIRQENLGLSAARNVGAQAAAGEIVAYTDSDCVADEDWLLYLVRAMQDQQVDGIGGPNIPPPSDSWIARCVAASPGGPSHVMLDDRYAEHIPGCNMAFRRDELLALGGFDPQFRQAGDDVDLCWRMMDAGLRLGYAPAAMVWHHRRNTFGAYLKQQQGYGRSEAMLQFKHPQRFGALGTARWNGIIYGEGAVGLSAVLPVVYHGRFGQGLFQTIYRSGQCSTWAYFTLLEWHGVAALLAVLSFIYWPLALVSGAMWGATLLAAGRSTAAALPSVSLRCRAMVFLMHLVQPLVRSWCRWRYRLGNKRLPRVEADRDELVAQVKRISYRESDLYWVSRNGRGREALLEATVKLAGEVGWKGDFDAAWTDWDIYLIGDLWHNMTVRTATEELRWPKRFTRARLMLQCSVLCRLTTIVAVAWTVTAGACGAWWALAAGGAALGSIAGLVEISRRRCLNAGARLLHRSGGRADLQPVAAGASRVRAGQPEVVEDEELSLETC